MKIKIILIALFLLKLTSAWASPPTWSVNPASYQYNMTMVTVANINCTELTSPSNRIGVFIGSTCRGTALTSQVVGGRYTASLFIYSNSVSGETMTFKVYNAALDSVYDARVTVAFQQNASYGTSTAPFVVLNNNAPTDVTLSASSVAENVAVNSTIGTLTTADVDLDVQTYSLVSGTGSTDNAKFSITGNQLKLASALDYETQKTCSVRIRASDLKGCFMDKVIALSVLNVNEAPTAIFITDTSIYENTAALTVFGTLSDIDPDSGDAALYALVSGVGDTNNTSFNLAGNAIRSMQVFNYETKSEYSIRVRVTDGFGNSYARPVRIAVKDANDAPTNILINGSSPGTSFAENRPVGSFLGTLSTADEDVNNTFIYSFVNTAGNDNASFQIAGNQLRTGTNFDYETRQTYSVSIQTSDGAGGTYTKQFLLNVTDSNDAPTGISLSGTAVSENMPASTFVARLGTSDPDASQTTFTYALVTGTGSSGNSSFFVRNDTLYTNAMFNFESVASYAVRVRTTDPSGASFSQGYTINVLDANDAPTDINITTAIVSENLPQNTNIGNFSTADQDASNAFTYTLVTGAGSNDNASFNIASNILRTSAQFDYEVKNSYSIRVRTSDGVGGIYEKVFSITVADANDNPTDLALSNSSVKENRPSNSTIGTLSTTDQDAASSFTYSFAPVSGNDNSAFVITGNTVKSVQSFNYEAKNLYYIYVTATDNSSATFTKQFQVNIIDSNDAPTDISLNTPTIAENKPANSFIGQLTTTDADAAGTFSYSLVSGTGAADNASFSIRNDSLFSAALLDFETKNTYNIRVRSTDNGSLYFEKNFTIRVINDNDAPTDITLSNSSVNENSALNIAIGSFASADPDSGSTFTYALVSGTGSTHNNLFVISGNQLKTNAVYNYEVQTTYSIRVQTNDGAGGTFSKVFSIAILDQNDMPSNIILSNNTLKENRPANTLIATMSTTDEDASDVFTYSFSNSQASDNAKFIISNNQLRSNFTFDYESRQVYVVVLISNDGRGGSYEKQLVINIADSNDAPQNISVSNNHIDENLAANTYIGQLSADDPDAGATFTYGFATGAGSTHNNLFSIRFDSLFSNAAFDFETTPVLSIRVRATDNGSLATDKVFVINVNDKGDAPTDLTLSNNTLDELLPTRTEIGRLSATDADATNSFTYTLVSGAGSTDNSMFNIFADQLRSNMVFNYELKNSFSIRLRVADGNGGSFEKVFTVNVLDSNDAPSQILLSTTNVAENKLPGALVANISTTDEDAGDVFTYSFYNGSGNNNDQFILVGNQLREAGSFDYEAKNFYIVYISSFDAKGAGITRQFIINVTDSTDAPTGLELSNNLLSENQPAASYVGALGTTDVDQLTGFVYTLVGGAGSADNGFFKISNDSLLSNGMFNYEQRKQYSIRVRSTDNTMAFTERSFIVKILDENDAPTVLLIDNSKLAENSSVGTLIGSFITTDADTADHFTYSLVNGTGSTDNTFFSISGNNLLSNVRADFETKANYSIRVQSKDLAGAAIEQTFTVQVTDVNESPVMKADTFGVSEDAPVGTVVGTVSGTDVDASQVLHYTLLGKAGEVQPFILNGANLVVNGKLNYEAKTKYTLEVSVDDGTLSQIATIVVNVTDVIELTQSLPVNNYMSPNGDGINDAFAVSNVALYKDYSLTVFNEYGLVVYKVLNNYDNSWTGTYEGNTLPTGAYFFVFKNETTKDEFKGVLNIVKN